MEDAEDLVGIDGAEGQVVVGIAAVVEVEAAQHAGVQQPRHDLLDVLRMVVMAGIDQHASLRAGVAREVRGHAPVGDVGVIEGRLEGLVFDEQALVGREVVVSGAQRLFKPADALADALRAGIIGAVGQPKRDVARAERLADLDGIEHVIERLLANGSGGIAQRAELVFLILKEIGIDGAGADAEAALELLAPRARRQTPLGRSHSTCSASVGVTPVRRLTSAASANFSSMVEAAAACTNLPKRVPVLANPQEGISIWKESSALNCLVEECGFRLFMVYLPFAGLVWHRLTVIDSSRTRITLRNRGPCTPLMRVISMSAVALGPEM